jgi:hypothetical protein
MISLTSSSKAQLKIAGNIRARQLSMELTKEGLAERSGVPLATLRKFEQKGESYLAHWRGLAQTYNITKTNIKLITNAINGSK